jgi:hypothetical protein
MVKNIAGITFQIGYGANIFRRAYLRHSAPLVMFYLVLNIALFILFGKRG